MFNSTVPAAEIRMILNSKFHFVALSKDIKNKKAQFCPAGSGVQSAEFLSFNALLPAQVSVFRLKNPPYV